MNKTDNVFEYMIMENELVILIRNNAALIDSYQNKIKNLEFW